MVFRSLAASVIVLLLMADANAAVVYKYSGNNFTSATAPYTTDMNMTLQFATASPLSAPGGMTDITSQVLGFSMYDGRTTLTNADAASLFVVNIDAATGLPVEWSISAGNMFGVSIGERVNRMITFYQAFLGVDHAEEAVCVFIAPAADACRGFDSVVGAEVVNTPGMVGGWSVVPVPAAIWLYGSGVAGLVALGRRKRFG